jgi:hypothetical protein
LAGLSALAAAFSAGACGVVPPLPARAIASISATLGRPPVEAAGFAAAGLSGVAGAAGRFDCDSAVGSLGADSAFATFDSEDEAAPSPPAFCARAAASISATEGRFFSSAILVSGAHDERADEIYFVG